MEFSSIGGYCGNTKEVGVVICQSAIRPQRLVSKSGFLFYHCDAGDFPTLCSEPATRELPDSFHSVEGTGAHEIVVQNFLTQREIFSWHRFGEINKNNGICLPNNRIELYASCQ